MFRYLSFHKQKYYYKILSYLLAFIFIYTFLLATVSWYKDSQNYKAELLTSQKNYLEQFRTKIDTSVMVAFNSIRQIKSSKELRTYIQAPVKGQFDILLINNLLIQNADAFSNIGYNIWLSEVGYDRVIGSKGTMSKIEFLNYCNFDSATSKSILSLMETGDNKLFTANHTLPADSMSPSDFFTIVKNEQLENDKKVTFFISFYKKRLIQMSTNNDGLFIANQNGNPILQNNNINENIVAQLAKNLDSSNLYVNDRYSVFKYFGQNIHIMSSTVSDISGWCYVYVPANKLRGWGFNGTNAFIALALILGVILTVFATNKLYKPVSESLSYFINSGTGNITDEFEYLKETATNINIRSEMLNSFLKNDKQSLKIKFLKDSLYCLAPVNDEQHSPIEFDLKQFKNGCLVVIFEYSNYKALLNACTHEELLNLREHIKEKVGTALDKICYNEFFDLDYKRYVAIIDKTDVESIKKSFSFVLNTAETSGVIMVVALGTPCFPNTLYESFNKAEKILEYASLLGTTSILTENDISEITTNSYYYPLDTERDIINYTLACQNYELEGALNKVFNSNSNISGDVLSHFIFAMTATISRIIQHTGAEIADIFGENISVYLELKTSNNFTELKNNLFEIFGKITAYLEKIKNKREQALSSQIEEFVKENYNWDVSLFDISVHFNVSIGYVSTIFKNASGTNFKDYINTYRVEKSKVLLKDKNLKIADIATMVGCNNVNTFRRIFIKYTGMLPGEYIDKL